MQYDPENDGISIIRNIDNGPTTLRIFSEDPSLQQRRRENLQSRQ